MKRLIVILISSFSFCNSFAQSLTERLIITDNTAKLLINAEQKAFDKTGNYCFKIKEKGLEYFVTGKGKTGGFKFIGSTYGNGGDISYTNYYGSVSDKPWYYKNSRSTKVFGPVIGKLEKYMTAGTKGNIAIVISRNDTISFYANGELVGKRMRGDLSSFDVDQYDWCAFSDNGNSIYYVKKDSLYHLFVNGKLIDKAPQSFNELHINNNGDYVYAEGRRPAVKTDGYDYMFFIHKNDSVIGPVRTVWNNSLTDNNAYYYSGDDNGTDYMLINNQLKKGIDSVQNITLLDKKNYAYTFSEAGNRAINVNGNIYTYTMPELLMPAINNKGEFAFYGMKDYFLYKFINGKQEEKPITNFDVRPVPLYITPTGSSLHYFVTDDSVYLYRDETLLFPPVSKKSGFEITQGTELISSLFSKNKSESGNSLLYMNYNGAGYWIFNGMISKPMLPANAQSYEEIKKLGEIVAGAVNDNVFFSIQKTGRKQFEINVNNKIYKTLNDVDAVIEDSFFLNDKELIFYGIKGLSIYQLKLTW